MKTFIDYSYQEKKVKDTYRKKMRYFRYWRTIEKKFRENTKEVFSIDFKHDINSDIVYDNEAMILDIANHYGYEVINEEVRSNKTIYKFKKA